MQAIASRCAAPNARPRSPGGRLVRDVVRQGHLRRPTSPTLPRRPTQPTQPTHPMQSTQPTQPMHPTQPTFATPPRIPSAADDDDAQRDARAADHRRAPGHAGAADDPRAPDDPGAPDHARRADHPGAADHARGARWRPRCRARRSCRRRLRSISLRAMPGSLAPGIGAAARHVFQDMLDSLSRQLRARRLINPRARYGRADQGDLGPRCAGRPRRPRAAVAAATRPSTRRCRPSTRRRGSRRPPSCASGASRR